jgi:hypothetical protein
MGMINEAFFEGAIQWARPLFQWWLVAVETGIAVLALLLVIGSSR